MYIYNSTKTLIEYLNSVRFSSIYTEVCFPLNIEGNVHMPAETAVQHLIGSASVGNKAAGFFSKIPKITADKPLRGLCLLVGTEMVEDTDLPTFFCREPSKLPDIFSKAVKAAMDTGIPIRVILAPNALNNYCDTPFPIGDMDRASPYFHPKNHGTRWTYEARKAKLDAAYDTIGPLTEEMQESMAFTLPLESFPSYIFPGDISAQKKAFAHLRQIVTTPEDAPFLNSVVHDLLKLDIEVIPELNSRPVATETYLCPGCPFSAIYANIRLTDFTVLTSIPCRAVRNVFGILPATISEYTGMISKALSVPTVFIGNVSEVPAGFSSHMENGTFILLQDIDVKNPLPPVSHPGRMKTLKNMVFPYSCRNIKKYSRIKINRKKCNCVLKESLSCIKGSRCPALFPGETSIEINENLCTGCRSCIPYCTERALS